MGTVKAIKPAWAPDKDPSTCHHHHAIFHVLHTYRAFSIYTIWGNWVDGKLLMIHSCLLPGVLTLSFPEKVLSIQPLPLLGRYPYLTLLERSSLCTRERGRIKWSALNPWTTKLDLAGHLELFVHIYVTIIKRVSFEKVWNMGGDGWREEREREMTYAGNHPQQWPAELHAWLTSPSQTPYLLCRPGHCLSPESFIPCSLSKGRTFPLPFHMII